ncbi:MAG: HYR domain-containing protein, partial [Nocardioidaceae bacterium]
ATSPTGATVPFTAVATDTNPASPAVTCSRASGSTFSIGATDVTCSATDAAGNAGDATFTVTVSGPIAQLTVLLAKVQNLAPAPRKNLQSIVQSALTAADKGHVPATCGKVTSFISQVQALSGKRITLAAADGLLTDARRIMAVLGCS